MKISAQFSQKNIRSPFLRNHVFATERSNSVSDNNYTHFSSFAVILRFNPNGHLSVSAKNPGMTPGNPINPGTIYIERQNGESLELIPAGYSESLLKVGHYGDFKDGESKDQIKAVLLDASYDIARKTKQLDILVNKSRISQHDFINLVENKRTNFTIGNNQARKNRNKDSRKQNFKKYLDSKGLENDKDKNKDRVRVLHSDRHTYAEAQGRLYLAQQELRAISVQKTNSQLRAELLAESLTQFEITQNLTTTRRFDLRQVPKVQLGLIHQDRSRRSWIPHKAIKSDTRRKTGKEDRGESYTLNLTKAKANTIRRREDRTLSSERVSSVQVKDGGESIKPLTFIETFVAMHLGRPYLPGGSTEKLNEDNYTVIYQINTHRELADALVKFTKGAGSPTEIAYLFEYFITKYEDPRISATVAHAIKNGMNPVYAIDLADTVGNSFGTDFSVEKLSEIFFSFKSQGMKKIASTYREVLQELLNSNVSLDFLRLYIKKIQENAKQGYIDNKINRYTKLVAQHKPDSPAYLKECLDVVTIIASFYTSENEYVYYSPENIERDLRKLMALGDDPNILKEYGNAYREFALQEIEKRKEKCRTNSERRSVDFNGDVVIEGIAKRYSESLIRPSVAP